MVECQAVDIGGLGADPLTYKGGVAVLLTSKGGGTNPLMCKCGRADLLKCEVGMLTH